MDKQSVYFPFLLPGSDIDLVAVTITSGLEERIVKFTSGGTPPPTSEDEAAAVILRDFAQEADEEKHGTNLFWFTSASTLSLENPESVLLHDVWTTAAGERGSLF